MRAASVAQRSGGPHPSVAVSGRAKKPNGLSFRQALRSSARRVRATPAMPHCQRYWPRALAEFECEQVMLLVSGNFPSRAPSTMVARLPPAPSAPRAALALCVCVRSAAQGTCLALTYQVFSRPSNSSTPAGSQQPL